MPSFVVTKLDLGPEEFAEVLPLRAQLVRVMPGSDRPDYLLCTTERAIPFRPPAGFDLRRAHPSFLTQDARGDLIAIQAVVICTRLVGDGFHVGMKDVAVNIAYVIDMSLGTDTSVDFAKLEFAAVGFIDDSPDDAQPDGSATSE